MVLPFTVNLAVFAYRYDTRFGLQRHSSLIKSTRRIRHVLDNTPLCELEQYTMTISELPEMVRQAWGTDIAQEFTTWLTEQLGALGLDPEVQIPAAVARRKVNTLVLQRISSQLLSGDPELQQIADGDWIWQVPIDLTFPSHGRVGRVGTVSVDARLGEVRYTESLLQKIEQEADRLADQVFARPHG